MEPWKFQKKNNYDKKTCSTTLITIFYTLNLIIACYMVHFHRQMPPKEYKVGSCHTPGQNCQLLVDTFYILGDTLIKELSNCRADVSTFPQINSSIEMAKSRLSKILEDKVPWRKVEPDINVFLTGHSQESCMTSQNDYRAISSEHRYDLAESKQMLPTFSIFYLCNVSNESKPGFGIQQQAHCNPCRLLMTVRTKTSGI